MDSKQAALCRKKLDEAKDRLAFLEYFEKQVKELNRERLYALKKVRQVEVEHWQRELEQACRSIVAA